MYQKDSLNVPQKLPRHIAIVMDGNGRWAKQRFMPRTAGHKAGLEAVRKTIKYCTQKGIEVLTLFAFGHENWRRPAEEVGYLMNLFLTALRREVVKLHKNNVQLRIIGDCKRFSEELQQQIAEAQQLTQYNTGLKLVIAANYSGQWDITNAMRRLSEQVEVGTLHAYDITDETIKQFLCFADLPYPDLFIRTSGEQRISNFMLWQLAYTELYFTNTLWPDFTDASLEDALNFFSSRQRRFGYTAEQIETEQLEIEESA